MQQTNAPRLELDEQLCFALYAASRAMTAAYRDRLASHGLTYTQYVVLLLLLEHDTMPMHELGRRLHLDSATLSPLLKRMEGQDLITRARSSVDERVVEVTLTDAGRALREPLTRIQGEVVDTTGLPFSDLMALRESLDVLTGNLRDLPTPNAV